MRKDIAFCFGDAASNFIKVEKQYQACKQALSQVFKVYCDGLAELLATCPATSDDDLFDIRHKITEYIDESEHCKFYLECPAKSSRGRIVAPKSDRKRGGADQQTGGEADHDARGDEDQQFQSPGNNRGKTEDKHGKMHEVKKMAKRPGGEGGDQQYRHGDKATRDGRERRLDRGGRRERAPSPISTQGSEREQVLEEAEDSEYYYTFRER